ncbi:MAG: 50S ribosomal protein L25/general stress protein Ctc [Gammaproteobacteria bacterium]|nr:50S ribosomal protein L25/general stress protein Ctc [Gammaproteobacteria bacterium]
MSTNFELNAQLRTVAGTSASRRLRRGGQVPGVMYGAGQDNANLLFDHAEVIHQLSVEAFQSAIINVKVDGKSQQAILRDVQMHPYRRQVLHVDFQRIRATEKIDMAVPIHYVGEDEAPGVKVHAGIFSRQMTEVPITCLPRDLPEYLEVDVSRLELAESVHLSDIKLPEGVTITSLAHEGEDLAIASVMPPKVEEEEAAAEAAEEEEMEGVEEAAEERAPQAAEQSDES